MDIGILWTGLIDFNVQQRGVRTAIPRPSKVDVVLQNTFMVLDKRGCVDASDSNRGSLPRFVFETHCKTFAWCSLGIEVFHVMD